MPIIYINTGTSANSGDGDSLRTAFHKINQSLAYLQGEYVQRGVSSFNDRQGAVALTDSDVKIALGYDPYPESNPFKFLNELDLIAKSYVTTASLVAFNFITLGDVATYLSTNQYVDEPLLDSKLQELGSFNQNILDSALSSVLTTSTLDTLISERNIVNETRLSQATAILQAQIDLYPDLTNFVTNEELTFLGRFDELETNGRLSTATFRESIVRTLNIERSSTLTTYNVYDENNIATIEFDDIANMSVPFKYGTSNQLTSIEQRFTILNNKTIIDIPRASPVGISYYQTEKSFQFTDKGLEFSLDRSRYSRTTAQNTAFTINATRPKRPQSPGIPGQIYVPNQFDILRDPYIYLCIDNSDFTFRLGEINRFMEQDDIGSFHTNWVRIPVDTNYIGSAVPFPLATAPTRPSAVILYPNKWNPTLNFVYIQNRTYTVNTSTMIGMQLPKTGNYGLWSGITLPPDESAPVGWLGANFSNSGSFIYSILDSAGNTGTLPDGLSLTINTIDQQTNSGNFINMTITNQTEDSAYDIVYRGHTFHLTGTPTANTVTNNLYYLVCYDAFTYFDDSVDESEGWFEQYYHIPFYISVVSTTTGLIVPTTPIG